MPPIGQRPLARVLVAASMAFSAAWTCAPRAARTWKQYIRWTSEIATAAPAVVADLARWPGKGAVPAGVSHMAEQPEAQETRSAYLLDGRRVMIADLIGAGLLTPGDVLRFKRPRVGQVHKAVVTADSTLSLEGGQEFRSPSKAAKVAADMPAVDGWHAWTVASSGRSLDSLRQELLD